MPTFRKKPVIVEAIRYNGRNMNEIGRFAGHVVTFERRSYLPIYIETPDGRREAGVGDWIIRNFMGEFYPVKNEVFDVIYEEA